MNRSHHTPRRVVGKPQPKRPKLDFSGRSSHSPSVKSADQISDSANSGKKLTNASNENAKLQNTTSDWDDDFSNEILEKVCLIVDLSPPMVSNESKAGETTTTTLEEQKHGYKRTVPERDTESNVKLIEEIKASKLENDRLVELIKTKDGEVGILRSQLKQYQEAKQSEALNYKKLLDETQNNCRQQIESAQKECSALRTELQFKELELKSLTEKWKQLESASKIRLVEPELSQLECRKTSYGASQVPSRALKDFEMGDVNVCPASEEPIAFKFFTESTHEGQKLGKFLCPEYFGFIEEPSVVSLYKFNRGSDFHISSLDFEKREKYKWSGLPKQSTFVKDTYNSVSKLFLYKNFAGKEAGQLIETVLDVSTRILHFQRDLLLFLVQLEESSSELDDSDYSLLENEQEIYEITINRLLDAKKINEEECGIESRRTLAMLVSLFLSSPSGVHSAVEKTEFAILLKDLAMSIGNLRKPVRYTGILAGITLLVNQFLKKDELEPGFVALLNEITEEIIFARPKLDVLTLVVEALAVAKNHISFIQGLCRKGSVESCALYMDSKLHQAMFFTKDACPLKLLCTQIMGLACIPVNREMRWRITRSTIKWLNSMMDTAFSHEIKWLPTAPMSENEDRCFDVMECLVYLLNSCLKDYTVLFGVEHGNGESFGARSSAGEIARDLSSVIGDGCLLFRRILKSDLRLLHESTHNMRFVNLLRSWNNLGGLGSHQKEAARWIIEFVESEMKGQEGCGKQNASNFSSKNVIDALKINDDLIIF